MTLKTVDEHNTARWDAWRAENRSEVGKPTGIACPTCGEELTYTDDCLRMSFPPQRQVRCGQDHYHFIAA